MGRRPKGEHHAPVSTVLRQDLSRNENDLKKRLWEKAKPGDVCPEPGCGGELEVVYNNHQKCFYLQCKRNPSHCRHAKEGEERFATA